MCIRDRTTLRASVGLAAHRTRACRTRLPRFQCSVFSPDTSCTRCLRPADVLSVVLLDTFHVVGERIGGAQLQRGRSSALITLGGSPAGRTPAGLPPRVMR